jgi:hypothetical protein
MATSIIIRPTDGKAGAALLISSALVALWFAVYGGFVFFVDATSFFGYANQLFHFRSGNYYYTLGYPLLIAITGFPVTGAVVPLLATQTAFAALTPWLAFKTFAAFERRAGIVACIVCLVSLTPFFFQNTFFHDGTGLFFGFLSTAFASMFFGVRRPRYIYLSTASATFAYFAQPAVIGFVIAYGGAFAVFALYHSRQLKHVAVAFGIFAASIVGFSNFQKWSLRQQGSNSLSSQLGRRLFFNEYLEGTPYGQFEGAAADKLRDELIRFFESLSSGDAGHHGIASVTKYFQLVE